MTIAVTMVCDYIGHMHSLTKAVQEAIKAAPCSTRALADEAELSNTLLVYIKQGERQVTPDAANAIADALDRWSEKCAAAANSIRLSLRR